MCHLYSVGLQHVTAEEAIFMRGRHPHIRSMALSVFGFKLCGKFAEPLPCREYKQGQGGGPFLSYVREDDTYESLARRLCAITGDSKEDWADLQLAITVKHPRGFRYDAVFLSQTQSTSTSGHGVENSAVMETSAATETKEEDTVAEEEEEEEEVEEDDYEYEIPRTPPSKKKKTSEGAAFATGAGFIGPSAGPVPNPDPNPGLDAEDADVHSLWDCFCEAYPNMCAAWNMPDVSSSTPTPFAFMGIQRSVANISAKNRYEYVFILSLFCTRLNFA